MIGWLIKTLNDSSSNCETVFSPGNKSYVFLYDKYNGIPDTLIINAVVFVCLLLLFTILRKIAWDYGRLALVTRKEESHRGRFSTILIGNPLVVGNMVSPFQNGRSRYNVWTSLFFGDRGGNLMDDSHDSLDTLVSTQDKGFFRWIMAFWKLRDQDILNKSGNDAIQYLNFQRYLLIYIAVITVLSITVILPINFQGNLLGTAVDFGHTTIGNLRHDDPLLWVHSVMSVLYLIILVAVVSHFRRSVHVHEDEQVTRTLMISNIPKNKCFHSSILQHFQEAYPEATVVDIQFAYDIADLVLLVKQKQKAAEAKMFCEVSFRNSGIRPKMRPMTCGQICCCFEEVDAINFYQEEEAKIRKSCEKEKLTAYQTPLGICFVTFGSEEQAHKIRTDFKANCKGTHNPQMSSLYQELQVQNWIIHFAPSPENIYWENLSVPDWRWWTKAICVNGILTVLLFFMTTPIVFLHTLDMLNIDIKKPGEKLHSAYLVQFLPTLMLWIVSALLPNIVYWSDQLIGHWTKTAEHHAVMRKTFIFLLLMVLILPSLGLTSAQGLFEWIVMDKQHKLRWECIFLPGNGSFFVNYIITSAFIGTALELLRFPELFVYGLRLMMARSQAERSVVRKAVLWDFPYGIQYAWMLCIVAIIVSYSIPCPLVTPFGLLYLIFKHLTDRYNIFFAYNPSRIDKHIHGSAVTFVLWAVILLQFNVVFFTGLRSEGFNPVFLFSFIALFITLIIFVGRISFHWFKHMKPSRYTNINEREVDGTASDDTSEATITKAFVASVLSQDLFSDQEVSSPTGQAGYGSTESAEASHQVEEVLPSAQIM